jgi:tyrosine-specific transport protein
VFSEAAIITSFIGFVVGLIDFYGDLMPRMSNKRDPRLYAAILMPPLAIALADPNVFLEALVSKCL